VLSRVRCAVELQRGMAARNAQWGARAFTFGLAAAYLAAGQYEQVIEWADRSLAAQPGYRPGLLVKVISLAHLGRIEEARDCLGRMLELEPGLTIARWRASAPHFQLELLARYVEGLRGRVARGMTISRRLAAILAADVAGYSRPIGADEEET
jgi:tetratricopeptide (TPR) repeat protein